MDNIRIRLLGMRLKHLRGRHDQRDHNRWPAGYQAQTYTPTGRRGSAMAARVTGGLAGVTQSNVLANADLDIVKKGLTGTYTINEAKEFLSALQNLQLEGFPATQSVLDFARKSAETHVGEITTPPREKIRTKLDKVSDILETMKKRAKLPSTIERSETEPPGESAVVDSPSDSQKLTDYFAQYPEAEKMFNELNDEFGITTWQLSDDTEIESFTKNAEQAIKELDELKLQMFETIIELEALSTEFPIYNQIHRAIQESYNHIDRKIEFITLSPNNQYSEEELQKIDQFLQDSEEILQQLSFYQQAMSFGASELQRLTKEILKDYNDLYPKILGLQASSGQITILPEVLEFIQKHFGKSVNENMQEALQWSPTIQSSSGYVYTDVIDSVNEFLKLTVDGRLINGIGVGDKKNPSNGPNLDVVDETNFGLGLYTMSTNQITVSEVAYSAPAVLHEFMHSITDMELGVPKPRVRGQKVTPLELRKKLNLLTLGFFQHRYMQNPGVKRKDSIRYVPDDFPDWYAGSIDFNMESATGIMAHEVLSMGITFLLQNPVKFAKEQPDYFRFISVLLSGAWIK